MRTSSPPAPPLPSPQLVSQASSRDLPHLAHSHTSLCAVWRKFLPDHSCGHLREVLLSKWTKCWFYCYHPKHSISLFLLNFHTWGQVRNRAEKPEFLNNTPPPTIKIAAVITVTPGDSLKIRTIRSGKAKHVTYCTPLQAQDFLCISSMQLDKTC